MNESADIFLSYSRDDAIMARRFAEGLEREGFKVWWDATLRTGESYDQVTEKALNDAKAVVVLWSKKSVDSRWVRAEATEADRNRTLVPAMIEPCKRPIMFELTHTADMSHWTGDYDEKLWRAFVSDVRRFVEAGGAGGVAAVNDLGERKPAAAAPWYRVHLGKLATLSIALIAALILPFAIRHVGAPPVTAIQAKGPPAQLQGSAADRTSVAVLPFKNLSSDPDQEFFADGLSEQILNSLARIHDLKITGRTSSFAFKGRDTDLRVIGATLNVASLLEGSVQRSGKELRITAQLINAGTGYHLWSQTYDRPAEDIFKIQADIAQSVAQALEVTLGVGEASQPGMTHNAEAYESYLAATAMLATGNKASVFRAIQLLRDTVVIDPNFAYAWGALANAYFESAVFSGTPPPPEVNEASEQFKRLMPDSLLNGMFVAASYQERFAWTDAARQYQKLRTKEGKASNTQLDLAEGTFLWEVGHSREAIVLLQRQKLLDPLNADSTVMLSRALTDAGDAASATAALESLTALQRDRKLQVTPQDDAQRLVALRSGDRAMIEKSTSSAEDVETLKVTPAMMSRLDRPKEALMELRVLAGNAHSTIDLADIALWAAYFHADPDFIFSQLERMRTFEAGRGQTLPVVIWAPVMRDVRKLPRFKTLAKEIGLVDYWREFGWSDLCKPIGKDDFECQ